MLEMAIIIHYSMHFARVLDLVDIYLDNNPPLSLVLDTIPVLFKLLEFAIKDSHQKPLENRIRLEEFSLLMIV